MHQKPPLAVLRQLGYYGPGCIAAMSSILLGQISADLVLANDSKIGNDLLARYSQDLLSPVCWDVPQSQKLARYARMNPSAIHTKGNASSTVI